MAQSIEGRTYLGQGARFRLARPTPLMVLAHKFTRLGHGAKAKLDQTMLLFKPATLLKWHQDLVRRKWTFKQQPFIPRRQSDPDLVDVVLRLAVWHTRTKPGAIVGCVANCSNLATR